MSIPMSTYVLKNNEQLGPFDDAMIFICLADGRFLYEDLAWREGWANWKQLREIYPAPAPKESHTATTAAPQKTQTAEETLWTGRPSFWNYWDRWTLALGIVGATLGIEIAAGHRWLADYLAWEDLLPWMPLAVGVSLCIASATGLSVFIARWRFLYTVTNKRLMMRWGIFARSMEEIRVQDIKSINVSKTGLSGFLLDVGTVEFSSAATDMAAVTFCQIGAPYKIRDLVCKLQA